MVAGLSEELAFKVCGGESTDLNLLHKVLGLKPFQVVMAEINEIPLCKTHDNIAAKFSAFKKKKVLAEHSPEAVLKDVVRIPDNIKCKYQMCPSCKQYTTP